MRTSRLHAPAHARANTHVPSVCTHPLEHAPCCTHPGAHTKPLLLRPCTHAQSHARAALHAHTHPPLLQACTRTCTKPPLLQQSRGCVHVQLCAHARALPAPGVHKKRRSQSAHAPRSPSGTHTHVCTPHSTPPYTDTHAQPCTRAHAPRSHPRAHIHTPPCTRARLIWHAPRSLALCTPLHTCTPRPLGPQHGRSHPPPGPSPPWGRGPGPTHLLPRAVAQDTARRGDAERWGDAAVNSSVPR